MISLKSMNQLIKQMFAYKVSSKLTVTANCFIPVKEEHNTEHPSLTIFLGNLRDAKDLSGPFYEHYWSHSTVDTPQ